MGIPNSAAAARRTKGLLPALTLSFMMFLVGMFCFADEACALDSVEDEGIQAASPVASEGKQAGETAGDAAPGLSEAPSSPSDAGADAASSGIDPEAGGVPGDSAGQPPADPAEGAPGEPGALSGGLAGSGAAPSGADAPADAPGAAHDGAEGPDAAPGALMAAPAPAVLAAPSRAVSPSVSYSSHVSNVGWKAYASNGGTSGGASKDQNVEAVKVKVSGIDGGVSYSVYFKGTGWQSARSNAAQAGTTGRALPIQAFRAKLTGSAAGSYDLFYRVYVRGLGWLDWTSSWNAAGTTGYDRALQGLQMRLVRKSDPRPSSAGSVAPVSYVAAPKVSVSSHVQNVGWQKAVGNGAVSGTTGRALRLEALKASVSASGLKGGLSTRVHVQNIGWKPYVGNGKVAGTTGRALRAEAFQMRLDGDLAKVYDLSYRVHVQNIGWMGWQKAGAVAGTTGRALRVEAVQVRLTLKNNGSTLDNSSGQASSQPTSGPSKDIMGNSVANASKLASWYKGTYGSGAYPSAALAKGGAANIDEFAKLVEKEAKAEGVRAEVVFAQMMFETGHLNYGGLVKVEQYNYCGLKTADGSGFQSFKDVRTGIRAHVQHLKAYASKAPLNNPCVDPRFNLVTRGVAPTLDGLSTRWSNEADYGDRVYDFLKRILE